MEHGAELPPGLAAAVDEDPAIFFDQPRIKLTATPPGEQDRGGG